MTGDQTRRVADALRAAIESGEYGPGTALPTGEGIAEKYGVHRGTAMKAVRLLAADGLVEIRHRQGAFIRERPRDRIIVRDRRVYRDGIGYYFDRNAQDWAAIGTPTRGLAVPPAHIADLLGTPRDAEVLVRDRHMGVRDTKQALQIATSYLPVTLLATIPAVGAENPGPGGIYDRIEEHFAAALEWHETISSRLPDENEQAVLRIAKTIPVLVVTRTAEIQAGGQRMAVEINETRMAAERFAVAYKVERDESAAWRKEGRRPDAS